MSLTSRHLPRRIVQMLLGLFLYGVAIAFMVVAELGAAPWDVLTLGLTQHIPLSFGVLNVIVAVIVLLLWIPLRERPGVATVLNALLVGPSADVGLFLIPAAPNIWVQALYYLIGLVLLGAATGLYIGARFGSGPRDGLMTGLHRVTGWPIWVVRTGLEVGVVVIGWMLGGLVGVGTVVFVFTIGPLCQYFLRIFSVRLP